MSRCLACMALFHAWLMASALAGAAAPPALVIEGAAVFDPLSKSMKQDQTILIEDGRIRAVFSSRQAIAAPPVAQRLDARGKFVLPGLIDGHAHVLPHLDAARVNGGEILPLFLANGVTTLRGIGDPIVAQAGVACFAQSFRNMLYLPDLEAVNRHPDLARLSASLVSYWNAYPHRSQLPPKTVEVRRRQIRKYQELTGMLHRAGVTLLVGTETPCPYVPPGFAIHQELELLVESGLSPAAALRAATINSARALRQSEHLVLQRPFLQMAQLFRGRWMVDPPLFPAFRDKGAL